MSSIPTNAVKLLQKNPFMSVRATLPDQPERSAVTGVGHLPLLARGIELDGARPPEGEPAAFLPIVITCPHCQGPLGRIASFGRAPPCTHSPPSLDLAAANV